MHRRSASVGGEVSAVKRAQNAAAKAAAARLAQVMASSQAVGDDEDTGGGNITATVGSRYGAPPLPARSNGSGGGKYEDHTLSDHAAPIQRPLVSIRSTPLLPPSTTSSRASNIPAGEPHISRHSVKRFSADLGRLNLRDSEHRETSELQDEIDMLQEENENVLEKLRLAEDRCDEAEARVRELQKQVAALGEGVSLEARLLSRKEATLRQREAALKVAEQTKGGRDEDIEGLRLQVDSAKDEVVTAIEQLVQAESEVKALRSLTQRLILTQEEMEEVVLKRCWLARYWGLAVRHGICSQIAQSKYEYWSAFAPLPLEIVISTGHEAKQESWNRGDDDSKRQKKTLLKDFDITGEGDVESMLSVERGLRELALLKVEDAVLSVLSQHVQPNLTQQSTSDYRLPGDPKVMEAYALNQEESEDVLFKQAWLTYFWRRAKVHGVEDVAEERLQFWAHRSGQSLTSHDAIDVDRGLRELRKLGIEQKLWDASRRESEQAF